jgi:transcriptional regulator with XRE-family HTH domain
MKNIFAQRLRDLRTANGLTMLQLAEKVGLIKQTISDFERSKSTPSYAVLEKIADIFDCQVDYLMGRDNHPPVVHPSSPAWLADLMPDMATLDHHGQEAVKALVKGLRKQ